MHSFRRILIPLLAFPALAALCPAAIVAYVAAGNSALGRQTGIHAFRYDPATGALSPLEVFAADLSPQYLAVNAAHTRLYATCSDHLGHENNDGSLAAFAIHPSDGRLSLLNRVDSGGPGPGQFSIHPSGKYILAVNFTGGSLGIFPLLPDGRLGNASSVIPDRGTPGALHATDAPPGSYAISGHGGPRAHMILTDPAGRFVLSTDLGLDRIFSWRFDASTGALSPNNPPSFAFPTGNGPRLFVFHPDGRHLFCLQEESSTLSAFDYDPASGRLLLSQSLSMLPAGYAGTSLGSGIAISPDGRFLYTANRLHNSIAIFSIAPNGTLTLNGEEWTRGDYPMYLNFDPAGDFLFSNNAKSDNLTSFHVNHATGALTFTGRYTPVGNPMMILFLESGRD